MKKTQFKGYILEEVLIYLIESSGYKVIDSAPHNDPDLINLHNGLNLRGRGANHQIDVLGELKFIPPFTYPIRLITEAKFYDEKVGIDIVRSEIGILSDINQNYFVIRNADIKPRYNYKTVIFSTSGFSSNAIDLAIAHQIQLVDLSGHEYDNIKNKIEYYSDYIFGDNQDLDKEVVVNIRKYLRGNFLERYINIDLERGFRNLSNSFIDIIKRNSNKLLLGMSQGGFMVLLKPNNFDNFIDYSKDNTTHKVTIHFEKSDGGENWYIRPLSGVYTLSFKLPKKLHEWIFKLSGDKLSEALNQKEINFSNISIYYYDKRLLRDYVFNLEFSRENFDI